MILIDTSQVMISNMMVEIKRGGLQENVTMQADALRYMFLNSLRSYRRRFSDKYGKMILCCDAAYNWRKEVFIHYKSARKKDRANSALDWRFIMDTIVQIRDEIMEYMPYRVVEIPRAEADDIIGVAVELFSTSTEKTLILSGDKDFKQLQKYKNVDQYGPVQKTFIKEPKPFESLRSHIMLGDRGDSIPNFMSPDDVFVTEGGRQAPIKKIDIAKWVKFSSPESFCNSSMLRGYKRNEQLVDLEQIPIDIKTAIRASLNREHVENRKHVMEYFIMTKQKYLLEHIHDF